MSSEPIIRVRNLSKSFPIYASPSDRLKQFVFPWIQRLFGLKVKSYYRTFTALSDISFEVQRGETLGIIGRNGAGKSTLLQILCGTLFPTSGTVEIQGRVAALLELGAGFNGEYTGRENVFMNARILGLSDEEINARFDDIVKFADIGEHLDQPVKTYSSGMYVRLAFAIVAHVDANLLIIDEALAVGDAFFTQKCMRFLRQYMQNQTVIFVSHDSAAVSSLCKNVVWLENGSIKCLGEPKTVLQLYLANLYENQQGPSQTPDQTHLRIESTQGRDMRIDFINAGPYRNDIEIFQFSKEADSFGKGGGYIESATLQDENNSPLSWVVGGESVKLKIVCASLVTMDRPIVGFFVNDRYGQPLFGENTLNLSISKNAELEGGKKLTVTFEFQMPVLPAGDYGITIALANGNNAEHVQHHWIHEALILKSISSSVSTGLIGIPMKKIASVVN